MPIDWYVESTHELPNGLVQVVVRTRDLATLRVTLPRAQTTADGIATAVNALRPKLAVKAPPQP